MTTLSARLDREIRKRGLSYTQAAAELGVTERTIYRWCGGQTMPRQVVVRQAIERWLRAEAQTNP